MNELAEILKSQEERDRLKRVEQLRRKGERFIRVRYKGPIIPEIDHEGICYNIRPHGLRDVEAYESSDINTGRTEWKSRKGARVLYFRQTASGDIEADIWDDPDGWNRRYIASHPDDLEVLDDKLREEIREEAKKPFKAELSRKEQLERDIAEKVRELESINQQENEAGNRKRGRPKGSVTNGINESTSGVDSSGVPRVAAGGDREGNTSSL
jgi:hypothetical protein